LLLITEGPLMRIFGSDGAFADEFEVPFTKLLNELGYWFELENDYTFSLYPVNDARREEFLSLRRWQWLQKLSERRMFELHSEVFEHFSKHPGDMNKMHWRKFEELLDAIFKNQGYRTELGPGSNDGGIDLRLYENTARPELVTIVQAKRYSSPIKLEAVAALFGVAAMEGAPKALFATTSRFQPKARDYALLSESKVNLPIIELADGTKIGEWCGEISKNLKRYYTDGVEAPPMLSEAKGELAGKIVVAQGGYNCTINFFAQVEAEFPHEVVLRPIGAEVVSGDMTAGCAVPSESKPATWTREARLLAEKTSPISFKAARKSFGLWDGAPQQFNSD
jgi:restriction system protein